ncbi:MAG: glycoside hydrolase family 3 N-terminal domain-containing protein [Pseudomonadales bacterium]
MNAELKLADNAITRAQDLLKQLSLDEKIGQLTQLNSEGGHIPDELRDGIRAGRVGSVINEVNPDTLTELQRIAREENAHGIPLLIGRDVIHGFKTIMPIPLGMAASWQPELIRQSAEIAAEEARTQGVNWTFAPMLDISRDPRWGRMAESFGEDPLLTSVFGAEMVKGFQNGSEHQLISCLKHFVGYGASESGRDYNTTYIPEVELRNVHLRPFHACVKAGAMSLMPSFSDLNGMPPSGNSWLLRTILRDEWGFDGLVVSDWCSITELMNHGVAESAEHAGRISAVAGVSIDMVSNAYADHMAGLVHSGEISESLVDELCLEVLAVKYAAGLFDEGTRHYTHAARTEHADAAARKLATESIVLLKNDHHALPLQRNSNQSVCLIGPLADQAYEQLGTWVFDADVDRSVTLRQALESELGERFSFSAALEFSRDHNQQHFDEAAALASNSDIIVLALGEEAILSGEAHCRTDLGLPGAQMALLERLKSLGKPIVAIILAGRPLTIEPLVDQVDSLLYAFHPGSQAGPALCDLLMGDAVPSGKLPVTMPRVVGQIPMYYAHGNTGRPPVEGSVFRLDDIEIGAGQTSLGNTSFHLDCDPSPLFPFGFGLSYTWFEYSELEVHEHMQQAGGQLRVSAQLRNCGEHAAYETVQLYTRDPVASVTRPVRELKAFEKVFLRGGEARRIEFSLSVEDLAFFNGQQWLAEPGAIQLWVGTDSNAWLGTEVRILESEANAHVINET